MTQLAYFFISRDESSVSEIENNGLKWQILLMIYFMPSKQILHSIVPDLQLNPRAVLEKQNYL